MSGDEAKAQKSRCVNNPKGRAEMRGFQALGVKLTYHGNAMEKGIKLYETSTLDRGLEDYGLEESRYDLDRQGRKIAGKKLLRIHTRALQHIFNDAGISKYEDIWGKDGPVERRARQATPTSRGLAVHHFRESLKERKTQAKSHGADEAHRRMIDDMSKCIQMIADMDRSKAPPKPTNINPTASTGFSFDVLEGLGESDVSMEEVDDDDEDVPMGESSRGGSGAAARGAATAQDGNDEDGHGQQAQREDAQIHSSKARGKAPQTPALPKPKTRPWVRHRGYRIHALCIGVNAYTESETLEKLDTAVADAKISGRGSANFPILGPTICARIRPPSVNWKKR